VTSVHSDTDLVVIGSGFGGSLLSMIARRLGYRVTLLERGKHPRFAIGESASPLAGILIEQLADRYDLPRVRPLSAFGAWQRTYPHVVCGLKRGFTYFKHETGRPYKADEERTNQLLVAASPSDELSDTHWLRSDVDQFLVNEAISPGVDYRDLVDLDGIEWQPSGDPLLRGMRQGQGFRIRAQFVVDASGPRGFLTSWPPLPTRSAITHWSSRCWIDSSVRPSNSARRNPHPINIATTAWSRSSRGVEGIDCSINRRPCSGVSQLPTSPSGSPPAPSTPPPEVSDTLRGRVLDENDHRLPPPRSRRGRGHSLRL
jgi:hypothetical protein